MDRSGQIEPRRISDLLREPPQEVPYWVPLLIPKGGKVLFGGQAKIGKSWISLSLARAIALGEVPFGYSGFAQTPPAKVLLIEQEIGKIGLKNRAEPNLMSSIDDPLLEENFWYVSREPELNFSTDLGFEKIARVVDSVMPEVLILDPMGKMHHFDENDSTEMGKLFSKIDILLKMGRGRDMSVVMSHHFGKPPRGQGSEDHDPLEPYNFRGASKWKDDPDTLVTVQRLRNLPTTWESWGVKMRLTLRHASPPPDLFMNVNERGDGRVYFLREDRAPTIGVSETRQRTFSTVR